jgi:hypothetical protein
MTPSPMPYKALQALLEREKDTLAVQELWQLLKALTIAASEHETAMRERLTGVRGHFASSEHAESFRRSYRQLDAAISEAVRLKYDTSPPLPEKAGP